MSALPSLPSGESSKEGSGAQAASWPPSRPVPAPPRPRDHLGTPTQPDAPLSTAPAPLHHSPAPPQNQDLEPQPASSLSPRRAGAVPVPSLSARGCSHHSPASTSGPCPCQGAGNHVTSAARGCANAAGMAAPEAATRTCVGHPVPKPPSEAWRSRAAQPLPPLLASCRCEEKPARCSAHGQCLPLGRPHVLAAAPQTPPPAVKVPQRPVDACQRAAAACQTWGSPDGGANRSHQRSLSSPRRGFTSCPIPVCTEAEQSHAQG